MSSSAIAAIGSLAAMVGGGPFNLEKGQWTDDTSMALCLAHSLLHKRSFDPADQMNRYCNWRNYGYMSSNGECFDIGMTVSDALRKYLETKEPFSGSVDKFASGNGSIMRLAPIPIYYFGDIDDCIKYAGESSRTTHGSLLCIESCKLFGAQKWAIKCQSESPLPKFVASRQVTPQFDLFK